MMHAHKNQEIYSKKIILLFCLIIIFIGIDNHLIPTHNFLNEKRFKNI